MPDRKFTVAQPVSRGTADVTIGGLDIDGADWEETFVASRDVPPGVIFGLSDLVARSQEKATHGSPAGANQIIYSMQAVERFMHQVLVDDDNRERWDALMLSRERLIPIETAVGVVQYLAEELTGRPTGPANGSPA
jgi:hypothetical protein